ncbi:glycosyltransferase family 25 protein [Aliamphritea hakodatensis]|uniref:glycosyltransferase family 25 protein n=1 Tax=Aliamphritea hakodatensis TaxID=2895352 RepID=UPI0022FD8D3A|nr:glycosyltransferase family 25 protein [Aliamphritea hakodatensis]
MKVFVISLKQSTERREVVRQMLDEDDVSFEFFDAVDLSTSDIYSRYNKEETLKKKGYVLTDPELGCFASHRALWQKCVDLEEPLLILEDNLQLNSSIRNSLSLLGKRVEGLGIIKLGCIFDYDYFSVHRLNEEFEIVKYKKGASGTSGYMISPDVAKHYLDCSSCFYQPVDDLMENEWLTNTPLYSVYPSIISRRVTKSTIGNRKDKKNTTFLMKVRSEAYRGFYRLGRFLFNVKFLLKMKVKSFFKAV